ncbi:hypothetical protein IF2G_03942 [Cordyceps javanica]|nr:hypothetical protein IF2G_03942 [Cordyceps javanica]
MFAGHEATFSFSVPAYWLFCHNLRFLRCFFSDTASLFNAPSPRLHSELKLWTEGFSFRGAEVLGAGIVLGEAILCTTTVIYLHAIFMTF